MTVSKSLSTSSVKIVRDSSIVSIVRIGTKPYNGLVDRQRRPSAKELETMARTPQKRASDRERLTRVAMQAMRTSETRAILQRLWGEGLDQAQTE